MELKELRTSCGLTQPQASELVGVPFRTYCRYEAEERYKGSFKYARMVEILEKRFEKRVLSLADISETVSSVCSSFPVSACYLFGSYAKGKATNESDVDLLIVSTIEGIEYYDLLGRLEEKLGRKVDLLRLETAIQNVKLINEILRDGLKIYGQRKE